MTTPEQPLDTVGDRYVLVELIGGEGRHEVWRGHDDHAGRQVVIARYRDVDDNWRAAFGRRARQLEALSAPGAASTLAHDETDDVPWLVSSYVEGETAQTLYADPGLTVDDALAVLGQTALALASAHGVGVGHGRISARHILVRPDGSVALISFAVDRSPAPAEDLDALVLLAHQLLDEVAVPVDPERPGADLPGFLKLLDGGDWRDPADIGRTALALATAQRAGGSQNLVPALAADDDNEVRDPRRPWYDDDERKRVRNRLIALGAIVVLGGAALLRIFTSGSGETSVPSVIGEPYVQAQHDLNEVGLRGSETVTTGPAGTEGTVLAQDPRAGQHTKVGSVVSLTVAETGQE